tara:strand:- start:104 stop:283 length:180 start_codon:yes stop_codon:yes gene_type:complete
MNMLARETQFPRESVERAARMHRTNSQAGAALGIVGATFIRLCRYYDIKPPHERKHGRL